MVLTVSVIDSGGNVLETATTMIGTQTEGHPAALMSTRRPIVGRRDSGVSAGDSGSNTLESRGRDYGYGHVPCIESI
jgi:hypothetical protein